MATEYSSEVYIGGSSYRRYRATLDVTWTSYNTYVDYHWTATVHMAQAAQYGVAISCEGKTSSGYITSSSTSYKAVTSVSGTKRVYRTHDMQIVKITASAWGEEVSGYGSAGGSTSVTYTDNALYPLASYDIKYNANGGSGAPSAQTKWYGETLKLSSNVPTRDGYTFAGWGTSADATGVSYSSGGSYTANSAITLYAVWTVNKTMTICYDANGGENAPSNQTHPYNSTSTLTQGVPTRHGYTFLGWSTSSTATSAQYASGASYTNNSFNDGDIVILYAVWEEDDFLTITYNVNGGSDQPENQKHYVGTKTHITKSKPTKDGYKFLGWTDNSSSSIIKYSSGSVYENDNFTDGDTITLYAIWMRSIDVKVRIPSGGILKGVHIRVPDGTGYGTDNLVSSDGYSLALSNGGYLRAKETN